MSGLRTFNIDVIDTPTPTVTSNAPICEGDTLIFELQIDSGSVFSWNDPVGIIGTDTTLVIPNATSVPSGYYYLEASLGGCAISPLDLSADVYAYPVFDLGDTITICEDSIVTYVVDNSFTDYEWHNGSDNNAYTTNGTETFVSVIVTNNICSSSDIAYINYYNCDISIPNVFTPNGDGINDLFYVESESAVDVSVEIFNRWGQVVGKFQGLDNGWDGKHYQSNSALSEGVYYYAARVTMDDGTIKELIGFIHLIND